jgi:large subunit ribosomal protein L13
MTVSVPTEAIERRWHVVDAGGQVLGRIASQVAHVLRGKHKPVYSPHVDAGDFVIVINAAQVRVTGRKREGKIYYRHTGYPGGVRQITAGELLDTRPDRAIEMAVRGMLPKTALGRRMLRKLKVYTAADHPHAAQKPEPLEIRV